MRKTSPQDKQRHWHVTHLEGTACILLLLADGPLNLHQLRRDLIDRTAGGWHPATEELRQHLHLAIRAGHITTTPDNGLPPAALYHLTETGRLHVDAHRQAWGQPWHAIAARHRPTWAEAHEAYWRLSGVYHHLSELPLEGATVHEVRVALDQASVALWRLLLDITGDTA